MELFEIESLAKQKIKGKYFKMFFTGLLLVAIITFIYTVFASVIDRFALPTTISWFALCFLIFIGIGVYSAYSLKTVRVDEAGMSDVLACYKAKKKTLAKVSFIISLFFVLIGTVICKNSIVINCICCILMFLIMLNYPLVMFLAVDTDLRTRDIFKECSEMMKGNRMKLLKISFKVWLNKMLIFALIISGIAFWFSTTIAPLIREMGVLEFILIIIFIIPLIIFAVYMILVVYLLKNIPYFMIVISIFYDQLKNGGVLTSDLMNAEEDAIDGIEEISEGTIVE